ncbi:MAG TPA: amidohydrolase family protein [Verrucomicrobiales bacterium]|nr:amidohydrolase family protein [Verrucomicrobiales bacterium]
MEAEPCIDAFCHILPSGYCEAVERLDGPALPKFRRAQRIPCMSQIEERMRVMDAFPGYRQILTLASPPVEALAGPDRSPALAQRVNDELAALCRDDPGRFPGFVAALPLNHPEAAFQEAARAVTQLGALGILLYSNIDGHPLDEPPLLALVEEMGRRDKAVWIHPVRGIHTPDYATEQYSRFDLWWAFGWPYETSLAMGRLVFSGLFDRYPDLVVITHHAGGVTPLMAGRLGPGLDLLGSRVPPGLEAAVETPLRERPLDAFRRFHADTASFGAAETIACSRAFFGIDRLLFGTDMPFDPEEGPGYIRDTLAAILSLNWTPEDRSQVLAGNAQRVFRLPS